MSHPTNVVQSRDVVLSSVQRLNDIDVSDNVPNIQFPSLSIEVENGPTANRYIDARAYSAKFATELETIAQLDSLSLRGEEYVCMLYSYRSISKAIPMLVC
jgi:hypothetical protein